MSDPQTVTPPRRRRDDAPPPPSPLDPYVTALIRWVDEQPGGVNPTTLAKTAAAALGWPVAFTEAVVAGTHSRRLLTHIATTARGGNRAGLSTRGRGWLEREDANADSSL